jgi:hypothetical protein
MSFSLGDSASAGTMFCDKLVAKAGFSSEIKGDLQVDGQLTQKGIADFEDTVNLLSGANLSANGQVAMSNASIFMFALPTSDPMVAGRLFRTGTQVHVSLG